MTAISADEARRFILATLDAALDVPRLRDLLASRPLRVRLGLVDPDCAFVVDSARREVRLLECGECPEAAVLAMSAETAIRCCQGLIDVDDAVATGRIAAEEEAWLVLRALVRDPELTRRFPGIVEAEGRADLVPVAC